MIRAAAGLLLVIAPALGATEYRRILVPEGSHPALQSAARILAARMALPESEIQPGDAGK